VKVEQHSETGRSSTVYYSDCGAYRYALIRQWEPSGKLVNFVMLNPSVADAFKNDPTVERCERRARQLGFGAFCVTNIFAWRDTDPKKMRRARYPIGPLNDDLMIKHARDAQVVVAAWGVHGAHLGRGPAVKDLFARKSIQMHHLGLTKDGHPRHPLYVPYQNPLTLWEPSAH